MNTAIAIQMFIGLSIVMFFSTINGIVIRFRQEVGYTPYEIVVLEVIEAMDKLTDIAIACQWLIHDKEKS